MENDELKNAELKDNKWYNKDLQEVEKTLSTNIEKGLTGEEVKKRQ